MEKGKYDDVSSELKQDHGDYTTPQFKKGRA